MPWPTPTQPLAASSSPARSRDCPVATRSGKTSGRHRLNRGGNRQANAAHFRVVIVRMRWHPPTIAYVIRCRKRFVARELYHLLPFQLVAIKPDDPATKPDHLMRVLIISPFYSPMGQPQAMQVSRLARTLAESGVQVDVLAAGRGSPPPTNTHVEEEHVSEVPGLRVHEFPTPWWARHLAKRIPRLYRLFRPHDPWFHLPGMCVVLKNLLTAEKYDHVIAVAEPLASHAALDSALTSIGSARSPICTFWFSDPVPLSNNRDLLKLAWRRRLIDRLVLRCLARASLVIAPTEEILEPLRALSPSGLEFSIVLHSFDEVDWPWPPRSATSPLSEQRGLILLHSGALYWTRSPWVLLAGAESYDKQTTPEHGTVVRLQGAMSSAIAAALDTTSFGISVAVESPVKFHRSKLHIVGADILCVIDATLPINLHLPSKVADYAGACKPILYIGPPDTPTCRALRDVHPAFAQAFDELEVAGAIQWLDGRRQEIGIDAYRSCYDRFRRGSVYAPLATWMRGQAVAGDDTA